MAETTRERPVVSAPPTQMLAFGERYSDGSGWRWAIHLDAPDDDGLRRVWIGSGSRLITEALNFAIHDPTPDDLRAMAAALNAIADALSDPGAPS